MKKTILLMTFLLGVFAFSSAGVLAANQGVFVNGTEVVNFTLTDINFGPGLGGTTLSSQSEIDLDVSNNVDFTVEICVDPSSDEIFKNDRLEFDLTGFGSLIGVEPVTVCGGVNVFAEINDADGPNEASAQQVTIPATLEFPLGWAPGQRSGLIEYTITGTTP